MKWGSTLALMASALALSACDLAPKYVRSVSDFVPPQWPSGAAYETHVDGAAGLPWQTLISDPKLRQVIEMALASNQDLAAAVANVAAARAQYAAQRSYRLPTIAASGSASINRTLSGSGSAAGSSAQPGGGAVAGDTTIFSGNIGISGFELDLFGRQKNLSRQAFEQYLATESGARAARLSIVAEVATAYVTLAGDLDLLAIAREQAANASRTVQLTRSLHDAGLTSGSDVADATTLLAQANSDVANYTSQVAQDRNALELLVGRPINDTLLPKSLDELEPRIANAPAGLSSEVLLRRPDVVEAEHGLRGAYANIGAARAAFFPTISLTTAFGLLSPSLGNLFSDGSTNWSANPSISLPLLGGPNKGNLAYARAQADYLLATYRKTAQTAYREVADALARRGTIDQQRAAQRELVEAAAKSFRIAEARYREGTDSFLNTLVAQRTLYSAQQNEIGTRLTDLANRIALYRALGADESL